MALTGSQSQPLLYRTPNELLLCITDRCRRQDLLSLCLVSHRVKNVASESLQQHLTYLTITQTKTSLSRFRRIASEWRSSTKVRCLRLQYIECYSELLQGHLRESKGIMIHRQFSDWFEREIAPHLSSLPALEYAEYEAMIPPWCPLASIADAFDWFLEANIKRKRVIVVRNATVLYQDLEGTSKDGELTLSSNYWGALSWYPGGSKVTPKSIIVKQTSINYEDVVRILYLNTDLVQLSLEYCVVEDISKILVGLKEIISGGRSGFKFSVASALKSRYRGVFSINTESFDDLVSGTYRELLDNVESSYVKADVGVEDLGWWNRLLTRSSKTTEFFPEA